MSRHSIGITVFAGMAVATAIAIIFVPLFFHLIQSFADRHSKHENGEEVVP